MNFRNCTREEIAASVWRAHVEQMDYSLIRAWRDGLALIPPPPRTENKRRHFFSLNTRIRWTYALHYVRLKLFRLVYGPAPRRTVMTIDDENVTRIDRANFAIKPEFFDREENQ